MAEARIELGAGAVVFREGDPPTSAFLIESGEVELVSGSGPTQVRLGRLGPGDLLGEMAVIDAASRTATARAVSPCVLIPVARDQLQERIDGADPVVRALLRGQLQRYRSALHRLRGLEGPAPGDDPAALAAARVEDGGALDKIRLETQLRAALENGGLEVRYQPILEIASGRIAGYEALVRWEHPERGVVSPAEFIRIAEETSLIVPVGHHVFEAACAALAALGPASDLPFVAVNVSARQLAEVDVVATVADCATRAGIPPSAIKIEITESLTLDVEAVAALIARAHARGIKVALDDFGTGFSNLGHLHRLRFDTVKLDQGFVRQMLEAPRCHAIVQAITTMVAALDADMVAEGVETAGQLEALRALGCRYAQGWLIGKAEPASAMLPARR
ncbi:MAG: EAL domain-containing protein [Xanthomonadaceae bacterium]|nr:EAL domain-containing protein [Xanthomonadaceae bacterium]